MIPETTAPVAPGYQRLRGGDIVPESFAAQVLPPPRLARQAPQDAEEQPATAPEASPTPCGCPRVENDALRAALAVERDARIRAEAHGAGLAEGFRLALAQVLEARPPVPLHVPPAVPLSPGDISPHVPLLSPLSQREETPVVPGGTGAAKGGKGGSAAAGKTKKPLSMTKEAVRKRRLRGNQAKRKEAAAESAREVSPPQHVPLSPGDMSPSIVPPGGTSAAAAKPPAVRKASWKEPTTPSPDKEFLGWYEEERRRFHPSAVDPLPPKLMPRWSDWFARALAHPLIGGDVEKLRETCRRWFADPWAINLRTRCPASAFIADHIWSQHIPGQHEGSAPAQARTPADARRRADLSVGRGEDGGLEELPDTPEGRALGQVLDAMRGRKLHYAAGKLPGMVVPVRLDDAGLHLRLRDRYARTWIAEHSWDVELMEHARALGFRVHFHEPDQQPAGAAAGVLQ